MSELPSGIFVAQTEKEAHVRVVGRGTFRNSPAMRQFAMETMQRGCAGICVDLADCHGMDSTFLGVLAGVGLGLRQSGRDGWLEVVNANERNLQSLRSLGLDRLMRVNPPPASRPAPAAGEFRCLAGSDSEEPLQKAAREETAKLMLEAHENLCRTDDRNEQKFADVKNFLREEIERKRDKNGPALR
jgi:anti-sigma B factor antagonist